jgi:hypothetical protein
VGPQGPAGPTGQAGIPAAASAYNDAGLLTLVVALNSPVPFGTAGAGFGTAITRTNSTTYTLNSAGVYRVSYVLYTAAASVLGGAQVRVNGSPVGPRTTLVAAGTPLVGDVLVNATAGSTVQIVTQGLGLTLASGQSASIMILKLQ